MGAAVKLLDWIVIAGTLLIIGIFSVSAYANPPAPSSVSITAPGTEYIYSLSQDGMYFIPGALGNLTVEIADDGVRVLDAPCREKICIQTGAVSSSGAWIACMPSRVLIRVTGEASDEADATSF